MSILDLQFKTIISHEVLDDCCDKCILKQNKICKMEGICQCDIFAEEHENNEDERIRNCKDIYFVEGNGVEFI